MKLIIAELLILNGYETVDEQALNILEEMISLCKIVNKRYYKIRNRH